MKVLYLDCISGISGDMTVGAFCDLGVKPSALEWEFSKIDLGDCHMHFERQKRNGIEGVKFSIHEGATHKHDHDAHDHHEHGRSHAGIRALISGSGLSDFVKKHALGIFQRIADAEGKIHGMPAEEVHFHEVGALDSIADIVLACAGIEALGVEKVLVSRLHEGTGWIDCAHGKFPIPSPATLEILKGIPIGQIDEPFEFITPTGAAIVAEFGAAFGLMPEITVAGIGYGIGTRELTNRPNALRAVLGEAVEAAVPAAYETDIITRIETNLDDLSPEITGSVMDKLFNAGALDVFLTPIQMKKNRPAAQLTVLCENACVSQMADLIFAETTSFGVRMDQVSRFKLERKFETVKTPFGEITVKLGLRDGKVIQSAPEFESVRAAAEKHNVPVRAVYEAALKAAS
jgi:uncharacterized protein (TIGR00299 family) protein